MPFQKGKSGNPGGRRKDKLARAALLMVLKEGGEDMPVLREIMDRLVTAAVDGERWAIQMLFDRLDGKAIQAVEADINETRHVNMTVEEQAGRVSALLAKLGPVFEGELSDGVGDDEQELSEVEPETVPGSGGDSGGSPTRH